MRPFVLAIVASIVIVPHATRAADPLPPQQPRPVLPSPAHFQSAPSNEQLEHLKAAAEHLAKAGRKAEAAKLLEQAAMVETSQAEALLAKKEKELGRLQAEVEQLRKVARRQPQITVAFQVLQFSREKLKQQDIPNIELLLSNHAERFQFDVFENPSEVVALVEELRKRELVKVLAEPTIVTVSGRPAHFHSGGEVPTFKPGAEPQVSIGYARFGTEVDVVPIVAGDKVRLEIRLRVAEIDPGRSVTVGDVSLPSLRANEVDTGVEMRLGQTLVLGGMMKKRAENVVDPNGKIQQTTNEIETIVLVTPSSVEAEETAMRPPVRASYVPAKKAAPDTYLLNFGGAKPRIIHQEEHEERLIKQ